MGKTAAIKKGIAIALSVMLAAAVLPVDFGMEKVQAAGGVLYVGNVQVTAANASDVLGNQKVSYDASTNTLSLNGVSLTTYRNDADYIYGIQYEGQGQTLNLVLNGTNTISTGNVDNAKACYGFYLGNNDTLKVSGTGTLEVTAGNAEEYSMGIQTGTLKMEAGNIKATAGTSAKYESTGIYCAKGMEVTGGKLIGMGNASSDASYGIHTNASAVQISGGTVEGTGGACSGSGSVTSCGICTGTTTFLKGGNVLAYGGDVVSTGRNTAVISRGLMCGADFYISDGKLDAKGGEADKSYGISSRGTLYLTGGEELTIGGTTQAYENILSNASRIGTDGCNFFADAGMYTAMPTPVSELTDEVLSGNQYVHIVTKMDITLESASGGTYTITPNQTKAVAKGTEITINPVPNTNYHLEKITVKSRDGVKKQTLTGTKFKMPGYPVVIHVTFEKTPCTHKPGSWHGDKNGHERTCTLCYAIVEKGSHSDKNGDGKCDICNYAMNAKQTPTSTNPNSPTSTDNKKKPYVKLNASSIKLQVKKSTSAVKVKSRYPANDTVKSYKSSNTKVATVDKKGKVTAKKKGKATITVTMKSGAKAKYTVNVQKGKVTTKSIKLNKSSCTLKKGKTLTLKVTRNPITATEKITYSSSKKKVATVNSKGKITAKKKGKATITVKTSNGKKATCKITVK